MRRKIEAPERLGEVPRRQRRPEMKPLDCYAVRYRPAKAAMARAYLSGGHSLKAIADHFGVRYATVSRVVAAKEGEGGE